MGLLRTPPFVNLARSVAVTKSGTLCKNKQNNVYFLEPLFCSAFSVLMLLASTTSVMQLQSF